jgi:hypothetical protein
MVLEEGRGKREGMYLYKGRHLGRIYVDHMAS